MVRREVTSRHTRPRWPLCAQCVLLQPPARATGSHWSLSPAGASALRARPHSLQVCSLRVTRICRKIAACGKPEASDAGGCPAAQRIGRSAACSIGDKQIQSTPAASPLFMEASGGGGGGGGGRVVAFNSAGHHGVCVFCVLSGEGRGKQHKADWRE